MMIYLIVTALIIGAIVAVAGDIQLKKGVNITVSEALIKVAKVSLHQSRLQLISLLHSSGNKSKSDHKVTPPREKRTKRTKTTTPRKKRAGFTATFITNYMKEQNNEIVDEDAYERTDVKKPVVEPKKQIKKSEPKGEEG